MARTIPSQRMAGRYPGNLLGDGIFQRPFGSDCGFQLSLVPVIALCESISPRRLDPKGIAGWLAMAALLHRYSHATETALDQDLRACRSDDPIGKLLSNVRRDVGGFASVPSDFRGALNDKGALFATYIACRHMGLRDLFSGSKILLQANVDRHHLLPRAQFPERSRQRADMIANIAFITGGANRSIGAPSPEVYLSELSREVRKSQCIPEDVHLWRISRCEDFWEARRRLLSDAFNGALRTMLPGRRIDAAA